MSRRIRVLALCGAVVLFNMLAGPVALRAQNDNAPDFAVLSVETVSNIVSGNFPEVYALFDPTMTDLVSEEGVANAWRTFQELLGPFQSAGEPLMVMQGELTIAGAPVQMAQGEGEIQLAFHPDGTIAGIFFLCARPGGC